MQRNAYIPVGALVGLAIGYFLFRDGRSTTSAVWMALIVAVVGAVIGYFARSYGSRR